MHKVSWTWRHAIIKSDLRSTTKHVLLTLSCYMNEFGEGCHPTTKTLSEACSLSQRAVCEHLELAAQAGWIRKAKHGFRGQKWANNEYFVAWPKGADGESADNSEGADPDAEGADPDDKKVLTEGTSKVPTTLPKNERRGRARANDRASPEPLTRVAKGSAEFKAWIAYWKSQGKKTAWSERQAELTVESQFPPEPLAGTPDQSRKDTAA